MKAKLLGLLPGVRWVPSDIPSSSSSSKPKPAKSRNPFSLKSSSSSSANTPQHGTLRPRKSNISLSSQPDPELDARTHAQGQSAFFGKLPLELRRMVYEYVVLGATVHLTLGAKKKFGHFVCDETVARGEGEEGEGEGARECGCRVLVGGRESAKIGPECARVLRVCRRMYSEAVPHLYRAHTFSLLHITHLLYLPTRVPQPRLNTIRVLRLRWAIRALPYLRRGKGLAYREDTANWERGWAILASMTGLRDLFVVLVDPSPQALWERNWLELEEQLVKPVLKIVRPRWAEVVLPYASCRTEWGAEGESVVRFRRPDGEGEEEDA
ncbi:hypothetical protein IQ07DRAFT_588318 [Pyrenochaeta sp. DS3sAY3a]|nr:hypothetical protein IQ07DRAFT_588318 [Pyrenochaeta sp. DS3sAY3a]